MVVGVAGNEIFIAGDEFFCGWWDGVCGVRGMLLMRMTMN